ncbi:MAG: NAD(+) kinase [Thermoprotei archaeon]|nr:MAG: NAD(+) kinase [Thermoprotei archaeon]
MNKGSSIGLTSRTDLAYALELTKQSYSYLTSKGALCQVEAETASKLCLPGVQLEELSVDALIAIGGDGTILRTLKRLANPETPILGVKVGKICFLGEVEPEELQLALDKLLRGDYAVEEVMKLRASIAEGKSSDAVNEVVFVTSQPAKVIQFEVIVGGEEVFRGLADGAIIATPTGSTGYALSAHGPVIDPELEAMLVVLLNPLNLSSRPLVVPASETLKFKVLAPSPEALVVVDGEVVGKINVGGEVEVKKSPVKARFIRFHARKPAFYERLRKLVEWRASAKKW